MQDAVDEDVAGGWRWWLISSVGCIPLILHFSNALLVPKGVQAFNEAYNTEFYQEILFVSLVNTGLIFVDGICRLLGWNRLSVRHSRTVLINYALNVALGAVAVYFYFKHTEYLYPPMRLVWAGCLLVGSFGLSKGFDDLLRVIDQRDRMGRVGPAHAPQTE